MTSDNNLSRREFLHRAGKAGAVIAVTGAASYLLLDRNGPKNAGGEESQVIQKDFSVPPQDGKIISAVTGGTRAVGVGKAIEVLGGIERFVKPGQRVLIKPNVAFARAPGLGATTHPEIITEIIRLCQKAGAREVLVTDNPINDAESCFKRSGIGAAATAAGAKIIMPRVGYFKPVTLKGGKLIRNWPVLVEPLEKIDCVIAVVPVKNHARSGASMSMKGWYGLLGGGRNVFHQDINGIIVELATMIKPTLVILDGTEVMMTNGPTGGSISDLKQANTIIAATDQVAADAMGSTLLDIRPQDLVYISRAHELGLGRMDYESLKPVRVSL
jgi:uncharacterized protein (DUF362 family)